MRLSAQLPQQTVLHAPILAAPSTNGTAAVRSEPPVAQFASTGLNEKQQNAFFSPTPSPAPAAVPVAAPPPAYAAAAPIAAATALYAYNPTDAGDMALQPNDRLAVLEYVNAEWWKGRNERTGQEGIFPSNYVKVLQDKLAPVPAPPPSGYGNMPLDVSQSGAAPADPAKPGKFDGAGKKFGKKMGNAAIFGAVSA